jgi:N-acetylglucosamine transport system substrate-binding protein
LGEVYRDTRYPGDVQPTTFDDKLAAVNYVQTVFAVWHSKTLFDQHGWTAPTTWDEAKALGAEAKKEGKFLFAWGKEAASYYLTLVVDSAIKEGGDDVRIALGNLEPDSWSHDAVQSVLGALKEIVDAGYVKPGGAGTQFTAAQAQWSLKEEAIMYPSGSWIEAEMKDQTKEDFQMVGVPTWGVSSDPAMGIDSFRASSFEEYLVPSQGKNPAAGKELLRTMLSKEAATNFAKTKLAVPIVQGVVPPDGFGSTALQSQNAMLETAGESLYTYNFTQVYGFTNTANVGFNSFLAGDSTVEELTQALQGYSDKVREDDSIPKTEVS